MKVSVFPRKQYVEQFGPITTRKTSEETLVLWQKVLKLPVDHFLILEPEKGEDTKKLRSQWYPKLAKLAKSANFVVRFAIHHEEKNVLIWKEAKVVAARA
jgi:hypothetical protein